MATLAVDTCSLITVPQNTTNLYSVINLALTVTSVLFQAHTSNNSNAINIGPGPPMIDFITGSNVGFVQPLKFSQTAANCIISAPLSVNSVENFTTFQICSTSLPEDMPIPGGCAQEYSLPMVAEIRTTLLKENSEILKINFEPANSAYDRRKGEHNCDDINLKSQFVYHLFGSFVGSSNVGLKNEQIFDTFSNYRSAENVQAVSKKICTKSGNDKTEFLLANVFNKPIILIVLVENVTNSRTSSYVSQLWVGCKNANFCDSSISIEIYILFGFIAVLALFLNFFGHKYFKTEQFLLGCFLFGSIAFVAFKSVSPAMENWKIVISSVSCGVIGGMALLLLWWFCGYPVLNVLFVAFSCGYVVASILFYFLLDPLGALRGSRFNQIIAFLTLTFAFALILPWTKWANILSCALVGSTVLVCIISVWSDATIHYIFIRAVQRLNNVDYFNACTIVPFYTLDIIYSVLWLGLVLGGCIAQYLQTKHLAPFPPCPYETVRFNGVLQRFGITGLTGYSERSPLIVNDNEDGGFGNNQSYGTVAAPQISNNI